MSTYNADSVKSFMEAMSVMASSLNSLELDYPDVDNLMPIDKEKVSLGNFGKFVSQVSQIDTTIDEEELEEEISSDEEAKEVPKNEIYDEVIEGFDKIEKKRGNHTSGELLELVLQTLSSSSTDEEIQGVLFDLLGFEEFDLISKMVTHRAQLLAHHEALQRIGAPKEQANLNGYNLLTPEQRDALIKQNMEAARNAKLLPEEYSVSNRAKYPHVFAENRGADRIVVPGLKGNKLKLPEGSYRQNFGRYEEVIIPASEKKPAYVHSHELIDISDLDVLCTLTFAGYKTLNRVQSLVFPVAYKTNENMLICAPTGAGKTDIALLTILRTISQYTKLTEVDNGVQVDVDYSAFKIVYVAPLKALAAEIVEKFKKKLRWMNVQVRELTGDMQLTRTEIANTQVIVTTPEKWDVVTRKATGDDELASKVRLLVIDEVHLLHEERGAVIETLVARTLRQVESSQLMIRVVGLSATLPNYVDVADFLGVNRQIGMFFFDQHFRPLPLRQEIVGVRLNGFKDAREKLDTVAYEKLVENVREGNQVMVFVHLRKETVRTARTFIQMAREEGEAELFSCMESEKFFAYESQVLQKDRSKELKELYRDGFGVHHAGMLRTDRNLVERMFEDGVLKVLVCTATLAWGVNLPASTVIIKGTDVYDPKKGGNTDLGILDVIQIFGRAGRPQFEKYGTSILCTSIKKMDHYLDLLTQQHPIESRLAARLVDNLNAEISLGTVMTVDEGVRWLGYTYLFVRMKQNPFAYGIDWKVLQNDPQLIGRRRDMVISAARRLHSLQMIVFDERTSSFISKDLGRTASEFYLLSDTVEIFNKLLNPQASEADVLGMISVSSEFDNITARPEEEDEIKELETRAACDVGGDMSLPAAKTNILLQSYIANVYPRNSALTSDMNYVAQNSARICRALLMIGLNRRWGHFSRVMLDLCKCIDRRLWHFEHPLAQFSMPTQISRIIASKNPSIDTLKSMDAGELGDLVHNQGFGKQLARLVDRFPSVFVDAQLFPVTDQVTRISVELSADFTWDKKQHGNVQLFWVFVESSDDLTLMHCEKVVLNSRSYRNPHTLDLMVPLPDPLPAQVTVSAISDTWIGAETLHSVSFHGLVRPSNETVTLKLLKLRPLPVTALRNPEIERIYEPKFSFFNGMQTMVFHALYNTQSLAFLGSPTGSGKTVAAELAIWAALRDHPGSKVVYIAPMKALVRERVDDWTMKIGNNTKYKVVELTGDHTPEASEVRNASIIVTTPEKFDGISRHWKTRRFVQDVSLVIMDEVHLLAGDRGPILEMIVSRMNYMGQKTGKPVRMLGMSTAVLNAIDMASWLGVKDALFNFPQAVRPVPLQMYIDGFPDNLAFCPLMKKMNKPAFVAIKQHLPDKSVLIFVASRRQTRLTALDLIHLCGMEDNPKRFLRMEEWELEDTIAKVKDETLKLSLQFGIALHHAGLVSSDRKIAHQLFEENKVQILVATLTLAWGVNLPAHLVIIKGTQFFDAKIEGYRDMDLTDVLQMMGRAGRPAFDTTGIAMVYTKESKKTFYKHFLNVGFPVESSLHKVLDDHIGAEIASGVVTSQQEALDFLSWTFLFRRVYSNPTYYGVDEVSEVGISSYLSSLIDTSIENLRQSKCVRILNRGAKIVLTPTPFLQIASYYYLSHKTVRMFLKEIKKEPSFQDCLRILSLATEYDELPTRHGEELINAELSDRMRYSIEVFEGLPLWDPHVKAFLLLQAYMSRIELPIMDYVQDTVTVLDQALRLLQAFVDMSAEKGNFPAVMMFIRLIYSVKQGHWDDDDPVYNLPGFRIRKKTEDGITLEELGKMGKSAGLLPLLRQNRKKDQFLRSVGALPTGVVKVDKKDNKLLVVLQRDNMAVGNFKAYCAKYPKSQTEGWFLIISDINNKEVLLMKRSRPRGKGKGTVEGEFDVGELSGKVLVSVVCDTMDIKYEVEVDL